MAGTPERALRELRIGLVLYGGASLAVYMNGIVTELWQVLRASQARQGGGATALTGSAAAYRDLLDALAAAEGTVDLRIVVDAIAGTSAGGLNGAVLAKAIIDGGDAAVLNEVWINDGDIERLRAEPALDTPGWLRWVLGAGTTLIAPLHRLRGKVASLPGLDWPWARDQTWSLLRSADGSRTVLDGTYFTEMIADTFRRMDERRGPALLPRYGTLDLFLTRTDFHGWPRHLPVTPLFEKVPLYERTHAHWMCFSRRPRGEVEAVTGFDEPHADFSLTYATRTTAGFPVAFAPVSYTEVADAFRRKRPGDPVPSLDSFARRHLPEHRLARSGPGWDWAGHAWMVDGGILDNKPFSYVTEAIERKPADHEVFRVVAYIEPDPETDIDPPLPAPPQPLTVAKGLYGLLRHEPVYADLRRLDERNSRVERIAAMLAAGRDNAERAARRAGALASPPLGWPPLAADLDRWREVANAYAASEPLSDYPGYVVLKARRAADLVAELACQALDYPYDARQAYFVRRLLRAWFERREKALAPPVYVEGAAEIGYRGRHAMDPQLRLLGAFDIPFRLRRLRFLVRGLRAHYDGADTACRAALDAFKTALARSVFAYETKLADQDRVREAFARILGPDFDERIDAAIEAVQADPEPLLDRHDAAIRAIYEDLADDFTRLGQAQNRMLSEAIQALPDGVRGAVAKDFVVFPFLDLIAFPLMDSAGLQDLIVVQTMRIAPQDAKRLSDDPKRLKGRELGAFAGFLRRAARENDLLWGRLDGADRLVDLIVRAAAVDESRLPGLEAIKARFKTQVMRVILAEEAARPGTSIRALAEELGRRLGEAEREGVPVA